MQRRGDLEQLRFAASLSRMMRRDGNERGSDIGSALRTAGRTDSGRRIGMSGRPAHSIRTETAT
jgi:hypothetical protein